MSSRSSGSTPRHSSPRATTAPSCWPTFARSPWRPLRCRSCRGPATSGSARPTRPGSDRAAGAPCSTPSVAHGPRSPGRWPRGSRRSASSACSSAPSPAHSAASHWVGRRPGAAPISAQAPEVGRNSAGSPSSAMAARTPPRARRRPSTDRPPRRPAASAAAHRRPRRATPVKVDQPSPVAELGTAGQAVGSARPVTRWQRRATGRHQGRPARGRRRRGARPGDWPGGPRRGASHERTHDRPIAPADRLDRVPRPGCRALRDPAARSRVVAIPALPAPAPPRDDLLATAIHARVCPARRYTDGLRPTTRRFRGPSWIA